MQQVREQLERYLEADDIDVSQSAVARGIGVSPASVSQFLAGKYTGDNQRLAVRIQSWLQKQHERQSYTEIFETTLDTTAVRRILQTARICHIQREIGVATGPAGAGKTRGVKLYAEKNPDVIFIEVMPYYSAHYVMRDIHRMLGFNGQGAIIDLANQVIDKLKGSGRLLIIDEAEYLPSRALDLVRRLHDKAGIGILLVGMPQLISNLKGNQDQFRQLYSRVGIHTLIPNMNDEDVKRLVQSALPGSNGVWKHFAEGSKKNARSLSKLVKQARQIAASSGEPINAEIIKDAQDYIII